VVYKIEVLSVGRPHVWCEVQSLVSQQFSALAHAWSAGKQKSPLASSFTKCLAATVSAAIHHSNMHHFISPMNARKPHQCTRAWRHRLKPTHTNMFIRNQCMRDVNELNQHLIETCSASNRTSLIKRFISGEIVLMRISKPKANTLNNCYAVSR